MNNRNGNGWKDGLCDSEAFVRKQDSSVYPPGKFGPITAPRPVPPCDRKPYTCPHRHPNTCRSNPDYCPTFSESK